MKNMFKNLINVIKLHKCFSIAVAGVFIATVIAIPLCIHFVGSEEPSIDIGGTSETVTIPLEPSSPLVTSSEDEDHTPHTPNLTDPVSSETVTSDKEGDVTSESVVASEPKPEHKHAYTSKTVEPTCNSGGYTLHTCSCGASYKDNIISQRGHLYGDWVVTKKATTTSTGMKESKCSRCGNVITQEMAKLIGSYENIDSEVIIENIYSGGKPATVYKLDKVWVLDVRSWGESPSITVTSSGGLHTVYYDKNNNRVEFTVEPIEGYVNTFTIREDGTFVSRLTGKYS